MRHGEGHGSSRSEFLKQAAGAAVVVAGAGAGAGVLARPAAAFSPAHRFSLEIDGVNCGEVAGVDGGNRAYEVVIGDIDGDGFPDKQLGRPTFEDLKLQVGAGMDGSFYTWIKDSFDKGDLRKSISIIVTNDAGEEVARRTYTDALITSVDFPALAPGKSGYLTVTLTPADAADEQPSGKPAGAARQRPWLCSNFTLNIGGLSGRVATLDAFTWKRTVAPDGSPLVDVSNIGCVLASTAWPSWTQWYANGAVSPPLNDERDGTITVYDATGAGLFEITLGNLGIYGLRADTIPGTTTVRRKKAEVYVERATWDIAVQKKA